MLRGEIWTTAGGGDYTGKPRPVVIVQDDRFSGTSSVTICPLTSDPSDLPLFRIPVEPDAANGLRSTSRIMADKVTTVPRAKLGRRIGKLADDRLEPLDAALLVFLGLAG